MSSAKARKGRRGRIPTCGELGGVTLAGARCTHPAGWQTTHPGKDRCREHDTVQDARMQALKKGFIERLEEASYQQACKVVDRDPATIWRWRKADPAFEAAVAQARRMRDEIDVALVEESLVKRLKSGDHSAAEIIFYLKNRDPARWNDRRIVQHASSVAVEEMLRQLAEDDNDDSTGA